MDLTAVRLAFEHGGPLLDVEEIRVDVFIDNTSTLNQISKARSSHYKYNKEIQRLFEVQQKNHIILHSVSYVKSEDNLADFWSRLKHGRSVDVVTFS